MLYPVWTDFCQSIYHSPLSISPLDWGWYVAIGALRVLYFCINSHHRRQILSSWDTKSDKPIIYECPNCLCIYPLDCFGLEPSRKIISHRHYVSKPGIFRHVHRVYEGISAMKSPLAFQSALSNILYYDILVGYHLLLFLGVHHLHYVLHPHHPICNLITLSINL